MILFLWLPWVVTAVCSAALVVVLVRAARQPVAVELPAEPVAVELSPAERLAAERLEAGARRSRSRPFVAPTGGASIGGPADRYTGVRTGGMPGRRQRGNGRRPAGIAKTFGR